MMVVVFMVVMVSVSSQYSACARTERCAFSGCTEQQFVLSQMLSPSSCKVLYAMI
jgi:hypothetical protein